MTRKGPRDSIFATARRIVIKIGSRTLAMDSAVYGRIADAITQFCAHRTNSSDVIVVSSGAIALGLSALGLKSRPKEMAKLQAAAAAGQSTLMRRYEEAFEGASRRVAQVLLTHADLSDRARANNARAAIDALLEARVVPIINENDTVAVDEIRFGDNDQLAALVAALVGADVLVLLSDVEGLLDKEGRRVPMVQDVKRDALPHVEQPSPDGKQSGHLARKSGAQLGTGGMGSKIEAARRAMLAGTAVVIGDARSETALSQILDGEDVGTLFVPAKEHLSARKHWILFALRPKGAIVIDGGAVRALRARGGSLLAVGVIGLRGSFGAGDAVQIVDTNNRELARGLSALATIDVARVAGKQAADVEKELGRALDAIVHRDDLVLLDSCDDGDNSDNGTCQQDAPKSRRTGPRSTRAVSKS